MLDKVADVVHVAMERAGISGAADAYYVQTKTPMLTQSTITAAHVARKDGLRPNTGFTRWMSPTDVRRWAWAVAVKEIERPADGQILMDRTLDSSVASCSSGGELDRAQVVDIGNAHRVGRRCRIVYSVMNDALDQDGIWAAIRSAGWICLTSRPSDLDGRAGQRPSQMRGGARGHVRGQRNAMLDVSDVHWHRQIKGRY